MRAFSASDWRWLIPRPGVARGAGMAGHAEALRWRTGVAAHAELRPEVVAEAKRLRRKRPKGGQRSYRQIATELLQAGYANSNGRPFSPSSIKAMLSP